MRLGPSGRRFEPCHSDHIDVFETEGKGKNRTQRIVIYYRFVGYVEIPEVSHRPNIVADTRKGVATKYLTEPKTA